MVVQMMFRIRRRGETFLGLSVGVGAQVGACGDAVRVAGRGPGMARQDLLTGMRTSIRLLGCGSCRTVDLYTETFTSYPQGGVWQ